MVEVPMFNLAKQDFRPRKLPVGMLLAAFMLPAAGAITDTARADPYRWCAHYGFRNDGGTSCGFTTWEQCQAAISGVGGFCAPNQFYDGRPVVTPEDRPAPRRRGRSRD
jgi:hypothetical protein